MTSSEFAPQGLPILCYLLAGVLGAGGQYFYKMGSASLGKTPLWTNWPLFIGMLLFIVVMVLFVVGFKLGGRLGVVYPVYATSFIWGLLLAIKVEKEPWSLLQLIGVLFIVLGVSCIAFGSPKN
jgi:multidrug transporter EmrE-like cation transporter